MKVVRFLLLLMASSSLHAQTLTPAFIENNGQWPDEVRYQLQLDGLTMWITDRGAVYDLQEVVAPTIPLIAPLDATDDPSMSIRDELRRVRGHVLRAEFVDASPQVEAIGGEAMGGRFNYLIGNDRSRWGRNCRAFASVRLRDVYDGIDVVYYLDKGMPRYDLVVAPGADVAQVRMMIDGADDLRVVSGGRLAVGTSLGDLEMRELVTYQLNEKGERCQVSSRFVVDGGAITYAVGAYDRSLPLVVDPLIFSTLIGGEGDDLVNAMVVGDDGAVYLGGQTMRMSADFPVTPGAYDTSTDNLRSGYVAKLSADGSELLYSTFLGSEMETDILAMVVNDRGEAHVTGAVTLDAQGEDFPTTPGAFDSSYNGGTDAFVATLSADGSDLLGSTFLGGWWAENGLDIVLDGNYNLVVTGRCGGSPDFRGGDAVSRNDDDFPTTPGAFDRSNNGNIDAFLAIVTPDCRDVLMSTFIGGSYADEATDIAIGPTGEIYLAGTTMKGNYPFPVTKGAYREAYSGPHDVFVARMSSDGTRLLSSSLFGGEDFDEVIDLVVDSAGDLYLGGSVHKVDIGFPTTEGAFDRTLDGTSDIYVAKFGRDMDTLLFSTLVGGYGSDHLSAMTRSSDGSLYLLGLTGSGLGNDFPTTPGAFDDDYNGDTNPPTDIVIAVLSGDGRRLYYGSFFGGYERDVGSGITYHDGRICIAGRTEGLHEDGTSAEFPLTDGAYDNTPTESVDLFVASLALELSDVDSPAPIIPFRLDLR